MHCSDRRIDFSARRGNIIRIIQANESRAARPSSRARGWRWLTAASRNVLSRCSPSSSDRFEPAKNRKEWRAMNKLPDSAPRGRLLSCPLISADTYTRIHTYIHARARSSRRSLAASLLSLSLVREKDANACAKLLKCYTERAGTGAGCCFFLNLCTGAPSLRRDVI